jgi:hypothetical protein
MASGSSPETVEAVSTWAAEVGMVFQIADPPGDEADTAERLFELLEYADNPGRVVLESALVRGEGQSSIVPRSLLGILFFAAQGVEVPDRDREAGRVTVTRAADGTEFDWDEVLGDLFHVYVSEEEPEDVYVSVFYRDHWFWIADDDLQTKASFALLDQLFALQAGSNRSANSPVLTIPIGG